LHILKYIYEQEKEAASLITINFTAGNRRNITSNFFSENTHWLHKALKKPNWKKEILEDIFLYYLTLHINLYKQRKNYFKYLQNNFPSVLEKTEIAHRRSGKIKQINFTENLGLDQSSKILLKQMIINTGILTWILIIFVLNSSVKFYY
jgi:hypothetical protein